MVWTDYVPSERDILLTRVQRGEITPQAAEDEATRLGLEPFKIDPNPSNFDPMREATWSLPMVMAWVKSGSIDPVREMWDPYREKCRYWFFQRWQVPGGPIYEGHVLKTRDPAGVYDIAILDISSTRPKRPGIDSYLDAFRSLSNEAQRADWKASGVPTDGGPRREIEPFEWADFQVCEAKDGWGVRRAVLRDRQRGVFDIGYNSVLVPASGFRKSFPAIGVPSRSKSGRRPSIQYSMLKTEFLRLMNHHGPLSSDDPDWKSKDQVIEALQRFYSEKGKEVSRTALQPKVNEWLEAWRRPKAATK